MCKVRVPFQSPPVRIDDLTGSRFITDARPSENRAVLEILTAPEFQALVDTLDALRQPFDEQGRRKRGRGPKYPVRVLLTVMVIALILNRDLRAARHRLYSDPQLREHVGLPPLTDEQTQELASLVDGVIRERGFVSEEAIRSFISWTSEQLAPGSEEPANLVLEMVADARLSVAADVIHRYDLSCGWVAVDGTRARAATAESNGERSDQGTAVHTRGDGEESFNQRHIYPAILGSAPLILDQFVKPPGGEITYWTTTGIPSLKRSGDKLGELITELRQRDGNAVPHRGLWRAAVASDGALANASGFAALIGHDFYPAAVRPQAHPEFNGYITVMHRDGPLRYDLRSDGAILCPHCRTTKTKAEDRRAMLPGSGDWGENLRVRCPDSICPGHKLVKIPLRAPDRNDYLPGSPISRGLPSFSAISLLAVWSKQYIAHRFLALERIEWVHAMFERKYGLGGKNPGFERRKISGTHANRFWYELAALIWNLEIRANLDSGRGTITPVPETAKTTRPGEHAYTVSTVVDNFWAKDKEIREKKRLKEEREERRRAAEQRKLDKQRRTGEQPPDEFDLEIAA